jgi:hypothetical protein
MTPNDVSGRYTVRVTVTLFADSRRDAYRQIQRALNADARRHGIDYIDAEDTLIEPFCANLQLDTHGEFGDHRDLALDGSPLCAACLAEAAVTNEGA